MEAESGGRRRTRRAAEGSPRASRLFGGSGPSDRERWRRVLPAATVGNAGGATEDEGSEDDASQDNERKGGIEADASESGREHDLIEPGIPPFDAGRKPEIGSPDSRSPAWPGFGRRVRWKVGLGAVVILLGAVAAVVAVIGLQAAGRTVDVHRVDTGEPRAAAPGTPTSAASGAGGPARSASASNASPAGSAPAGGTAVSREEVVVHVAGAVAHPGIVTLPRGSRVFQAIAAAGGERPEADLAALNLAATVEDGQQVLVPAQGDAPQPPTAAGASGTGNRPAAKVNINTAGVEELGTLPKVGPVLAQRIVDWRTQHGKFSSPQDLDAVDGVGPKLLESLIPLVSV